MSAPPKIVIAIDGTAASGKGTLARALAARLGLAWLDTGKLYRYVGWAVLCQEGNPADEAQAAAAARSLRGLDPQALADPALRGDEAGKAASIVAAQKAVRAELIDMQRNFAQNPPPLPDGAPARGAVLDGRDIGNHICPDADIKFFITAAPEIRAQRRFKELQSQGIQVTYDAVLADMRERDARDAGRETAPMKPANDAVLLDTGAMSADEVLEKALSLIEEKLGISR